MATQFGSPAPGTNGAAHHDSTPTDDLSRIVQALEAIYHPSTNNETRQAASSFLEDAKRAPEAPERGYSLAIDASKNLVLRHYGLSMLEHYIKYVWHGDEEAEAVLRRYIMQLAENLSPEDPAYFRNKVAQLWTEVAKRSWGVHWMDMDQMLVVFWQSSLLRKSFVLYVLETLSEEVFTKEEGGVRGNELSQACIEIFTPATVLPERAATRYEDAPVLRYGEEGWLKRICTYLASYFTGDIERDDQSKVLAAKALMTIRSTLNWISPKAVSATNAIVYLCAAVDFDDIKLKDVSAAAFTRDDALLTVYRPESTLSMLYAVG